MRESARIVRAAQKRLKDRLNELEVELDEVTHEREAQRTQMHVLLDSFPEAKHIISDQPENAVKSTSNAQLTTNGVAVAGRCRNEANARSLARTQCANEEQRRVLQRSAGRQNLRLWEASALMNVEPTQHQNEVVRDPKLEAERHYKVLQALG